MTKKFSKTLTSLVVPFFLLVSCTKDETEANSANEKAYPVAITVSNKDANNTTAEPALPLNAVISQLTFIAYSEDGNEFMRRTQFSTSADFGKITLNLPKRFFTIIAVGSKSLFGINQCFQTNTTNPILLPFKSANMQYWQDNEFMSHKVYKTGDTFLGTIALPITNNQSFQLPLKRIVGKLEVTVEDVNQFKVDVNNEATGYYFQSRTSFGSTDDDMGFEIDNSKGPISLYILRTDKPLNIEIIGGGVRKALQVPVFKNQRTVVSGKLLESTGALGLNVSIDQAWSSDTTLVKF